MSDWLADLVDGIVNGTSSQSKQHSSSKESCNGSFSRLDVVKETKDVHMNVSVYTHIYNIYNVCVCTHVYMSELMLIRNLM